MHRISLKVDWRYCVALYCVVMLWASLHELSHHVAGYVACGSWGTKTFNYFETSCHSTASWYATFVGPLFSFAAMWWGWWLLARTRSTPLDRQLGFAVIFAQIPLQRLIGPLFHMNDEYYAASHFLGRGSFTMVLTFVVIALCTLPPLVGAWRAIANPRRAAWFAFYLTLFPYLLWGPVFAGLEYLLVGRHVLDGRWIGIAHLFLLNEVITIAAYVLTKRWLDRASAPTAALSLVPA